MKTLIVDNNSKHIDEIKKLCPEHSITVKRWSEITPNDYREFDLVILSGGSGMAINEHEQDLANEIALIKNSDKPIIGICLGFELICHAFGCKMEREDEIQKGIFEITPTALDPIFYEIAKPRVYMAHKWHVKEVCPELKVLARSEKGIELIRHQSKAIYGFQFHPEITAPSNDGAMIFKNCLSTF